ncbi:hypothetical protein TNIN_123001 [Trichonephila inaurata madagascariensis]|uniref:Uncharacterized protein n=1 Tax=Trichonephila inaurata madagascariensis TaxID=2747483 RepID=A0A8X7CLK5_9ARAC|nr:hypothetical protein TNIN_123001 [Trichonephila inaurata madagascariensis]
MATPFDDMDLSPVPSRPNTPNTEETPCQRPERTMGMIKLFTTTRDGSPSTPKSTTKRKDDEFQLPLSRKTARHVLLETPQYMDLNLEKPI